MRFGANVIPVEAESCASAAPRCRLLVVDRQLTFVSFARFIARRLGYETGAVLNARELEARVRAWHPTVLVIEIVMPEMEGIEITAMLAEAGFEGHLVLVTAREPAYLELVRKAAEAKGLRVAACSAKPMRSGDMVSALQRCAPDPVLIT
jgi:CheY-like chemotaxis protein